MAEHRSKGIAAELTIAESVEHSVTQLLPTPDRWNRAVMLAHLYLKNDSAIQVAAANAQTNLSLQFNLGDSLLEVLLRRGTSDARIQFLGQIDDWQVYHALEKVLPTAILTEQEVFTLLVHSAVFGRGDMTLGLILQAASKWASHQFEVAVSIVNQWVDGRSEVLALDESAIRSLVTGVVRGSSDIAWRDSIIDKLEGKGRKQDRKLALILTCHAWPESADNEIEIRHELLIERTRRYPEWLVDTALWAIRFDAERHPIETFETARKLYALLPPDSGEESVRRATAGLVAVAWRAIPQAKQKQLELRSFIQVLDYAQNYTPAFDLLTLDSVLADLAGVAEEQLKKFLQTWIAKYATDLWHRNQSLDELFPLFVDRSPGRIDAWLLEWMVSAGIELRQIATFLFGKRTTKTLPRDALEKMSIPRVHALCHVLTGSPLLDGSIWVPGLVRLGTTRPDALDLVKECLLEDALEHYPGHLRESLKQWPDIEPWVDARAQLLERLDARLAAKSLRRGISELHYFPTQFVWKEREQAEFAREMANAQKKSIWMQIATRVPIARGESSSIHGDPSNAMPFTLHEVSSELPALEIVDPVQAQHRRLEHQRQAEQLIAKADGEEHASHS